MTITKTAKSVALRLSTKSTSKASAIDPSKHKTDFLKSLNTDKVQRITIQLILLWYTRLWSKTIVCYPVFKCSKTRRFCSVFKVISLSNAQDPIIPYHVKQCKQNPQNMSAYFCPSSWSMKKDTITVPIHKRAARSPDRAPSFTTKTSKWLSPHWTIFQSLLYCPEWVYLLWNSASRSRR